MNKRFHTKLVRAQCEMDFKQRYVFEFEGQQPDESTQLGSSDLLRVNQPIHLTILRHKTRGDGRPEILGTKYIDWRSVLFCNSVEVNAEIMPVDFTDKSSIGIIELHLDLVPRMAKS